jgi:hypothetical protein
MKFHASQPLRENNRDKFDEEACDRESSQDEDHFPASDEADEPNGFDDADDLSDIDPDAPFWDAFLADDDERDPQPDPNDFYCGD